MRRFVSDLYAAGWRDEPAVRERPVPVHLRDGLSSVRNAVRDEHRSGDLRHLVHAVPGTRERHGDLQRHCVRHSVQRRVPRVQRTVRLELLDQYLRQPMRRVPRWPDWERHHRHL